MRNVVKSPLHEKLQLYLKTKTRHMLHYIDMCWDWASNCHNHKEKTGRISMAITVLGYQGCIPNNMAMANLIFETGTGNSCFRRNLTTGTPNGEMLLNNFLTGRRSLCHFSKFSERTLFIEDARTFPND